MLDLTEEQRAIRDGVAATCRRFGDDYWAGCENQERFPREFHRAMAEGGWLGVGGCPAAAGWPGPAGRAGAARNALRSTAPRVKIDGVLRGSLMVV